MKPGFNVRVESFHRCTYVNKYQLHTSYTRLRLALRGIVLPYIPQCRRDCCELIRPLTMINPPLELSALQPYANNNIISTDCMRVCHYASTRQLNE